MKKIAFLVLLLAVTCAVILVPPFLSGHREENISNKITYRNYYLRSRPKLTGEQVARLYHNCEIGIGFNSSYTTEEGDDVEIIREDVLELIDMLFSENEPIQISVKNLILNSELSYFRNSGLIKIDNRPTAISFISCGTKSSDGYIEINYEEKTKTIVRFSCYIFDEGFEDIEKAGTSSPIENNYFQNHLKLNEKEYYFNLIVVPMVEEEQSIKRFYVNCGIAERGNKAVYEGEEIYN